MSNEGRYQHFSLNDDVYYFNHAGVAPLPTQTAEVIKRFADECQRLGSQNYLTWMRIEQELRERLRWLINAPSSNDIALLKSTSEGLSLVAYGLPWSRGDNVVIPLQEFPSNRIVWESLTQRYGIEVRKVDLRSVSEPELALQQQCDHRTVLMSVSAVQYGTGLCLDLAKLGQFCRENTIFFCVDAIQQLGALPFDVQSIQADFVVADGHKWMLGLEGTALFYCSEEIRGQLKLHQYGWRMIENYNDFDHLEWKVSSTAQRFECGSPNMLGIHALHASLSLIKDIGLTTIAEKIINNTSYIMDKISQLAGYSIVTPTEKGRFAGIVTFRREAGDEKNLVQYLMNKGVMCAFRAGGVRLSPHFYIENTDIDYVFDQIQAYR